MSEITKSITNNVWECVPSIVTGINCEDVGLLGVAFCDCGMTHENNDVKVLRNSMILPAQLEVQDLEKSRVRACPFSRKEALVDVLEFDHRMLAAHRTDLIAKTKKKKK